MFRIHGADGALHHLAESLVWAALLPPCRRRAENRRWRTSKSSPRTTSSHPRGRQLVAGNASCGFRRRNDRASTSERRRTSTFRSLGRDAPTRTPRPKRPAAPPSLEASLEVRG